MTILWHLLQLQNLPRNMKRNIVLYFLILLSTLTSFDAKKSKKKNDERASLLGLTDEYSTFELPFKYSPNLIKIGNCPLTLTFIYCNLTPNLLHKSFYFIYKINFYDLFLYPSTIRLFLFNYNHQFGKIWV